MNERIRELALQAGFKTDRLGHLFGGDDIEKFAELIVKEIVEECAKVCVEHAGWTPRMIAEQVKDHFGVE